LPIRRRGHEEAVHAFHAPAAGHEVLRKPVEQLGMAWAFAEQAEVAGGVDQPLAEVVEPDAIDILETLVWHFDEPFADSSALPTYYLSKLTREHVTVALNGDAGDENFAGYPRYLVTLLSQYLYSGAGPLRGVMGSTAAQGRKLFRDNSKMARFHLRNPFASNLSVCYHTRTLPRRLITGFTEDATYYIFMTVSPMAGAPNELRNDCGDPKPGTQNAPSHARRSAKP